jgi:outer membrane protein assembly factor BamB
LVRKVTTGFFVESSPAVANGVVYVGSDDDNVYALNARTGAKLWSYTPGDHVESSPVLSARQPALGTRPSRSASGTC